MQRPRGAARPRRRRPRPARIALALGVLLTGGAPPVASQTRDGRDAAEADARVVLNPDADATVSARLPTTNFGRATRLEVSGKPRSDSYLRFRVPAGARRAVLRLWVADPTNDGPKVRRAVGPLDEAAADWTSRAMFVGTAVDSGTLSAGTWAEWDVTALVEGAGDVTLAALADSSDGVEFGSRESDHSPQLVVELTRPAPSPPTPGPTPTGTSSSTTTTSITTSSTRPGPGGAPDCRPSWAPAEPIAQLGDGLGEMSAFIATPNHHGWGWGIRDSGKPASLYAIKPTAGGITRTQEFPAHGLTNSDWEDMAHTPGPEPGTGHLWVLENVGNGWSGDRWIHQFEEPDPENPPPLPAATLVGSYQWAYPDGQANTETMFVFDGDLVVVSKTDPSRVYRFHDPLQPSVVNVPTYVGTLPAGQFLSTAAISADQRTLAVADHGNVDIYVNRGDVNDLRALIANPVVRHDMPPDNREGGSFFPYGSCDILLVAESKTIWRLEHN